MGINPQQWALTHDAASQPEQTSNLRGSPQEPFHPPSQFLESDGNTSRAHTFSPQYHDPPPPYQGYGDGSSVGPYSQAPFDRSFSIPPTADSSQFLGSSGDTLPPHMSWHEALRHDFLPPSPSYQHGGQDSGLVAGLSSWHSDTHLPFQEQSSSEFDPETTASLHTSWDESQGNDLPSSVWSGDYSQYTSTYPSSSQGWESHHFPEQTDQSEVPNDNFEHASSSHFQETLQNMLNYPVAFMDKNNQSSTMEYPIGGGNPNSSYAFVDLHNPTNPLYFTNDLMDQRYTNSDRYMMLSHTDGLVRLYTPQNAYDYAIGQRNQRSQVTQIGRNAIDNSTDQNTNNDITRTNKRETGKTRSQLLDDRLKREKGKTRYKLRNEEKKRETGKGMSKLLNEKLKI